MSTRSLRSVVLAGVVAGWACSSGTTAPSKNGNPVDNSPPVVLSVLPAGNATNVNLSSPVSIAFNHSMMVGMEFLVVLHEGSILGAQVVGSSSWSSDHRVLTFTPAAPLKSKTTYVLHLSPNLKDASGQGIDFAGCAAYLGGQAPAGGWTMGGMMGGNGSGMMGPGWQAGSGTWGYGMVLTFVTA